MYPLDQYDKNFALKVNLALIATFLFLTKGFWISIIALKYKDKMDELIGLAFSNSESHAAAIIAAIPVFFVLFAWARRDPKAKSAVRSLWARGRLLLIISALANLLIACYSSYSRPITHGNDIVLLVLSIVCTNYVIRSKRVSALFNSFPITDDESERRRKKKMEEKSKPNNSAD